MDQEKLRARNGEISAGPFFIFFFPFLGLICRPIFFNFFHFFPFSSIRLGLFHSGGPVAFLFPFLFLPGWPIVCFVFFLFFPSPCLSPSLLFPHTQHVASSTLTSCFFLGLFIFLNPEKKRPTTVYCFAFLLSV